MRYLKTALVGSGLAMGTIGLGWHIHQALQEGLPEIHKAPIPFLVQGGESSPVIANGRVVIFNTLHNGKQGFGFEIYDAETKALLKKVDWPYGYINATNLGGEIWVLGVGDTSKRGNAVGLMRLSEKLEILDTRELVKADANQSFFNTSILWDGRRYVMAAEVNSNPWGQYRPRFLASHNLKDWRYVGDFLPDGYAACPTIEYLNGWYYVFYLSYKEMSQPLNGQPNRFTIKLARTRDFKSFQKALGNVLAPDALDGPNASDMELVEHGGRTFISYSYGNQLGQGGNRLAVFEGGLEKLVSRFWFSPLPTR